jgi:hypothetical protein
MWKLKIYFLCLLSHLLNSQIFSRFFFFHFSLMCRKNSSLLPRSDLFLFFFFTFWIHSRNSSSSSVSLNVLASFVPLGNYSEELEKGSKKEFLDKNTSREIYFVLSHFDYSQELLLRRLFFYKSNFCPLIFIIICRATLTTWV